MTNEITAMKIPSVDEEIKAFELVQRKAQALSKSKLVPDMYQNNIADCIIAMDMANRMNANYLMVMQNLSIIKGRPSWSSQWIIAAINNCGKYTSLRFEVKDLGDKQVTYNEISWVNKQKITTQKTETIKDQSCIAYATEKETGERLESAKITLEMAVKEGWYTKDGSKWKTMPEIMLRYRAAAFFGRIYAPELLMGLHSIEEVQDFSDKYKDAINVTPSYNQQPEKFNPEISEIDPIEEELTIPQEVRDEISEFENMAFV